MGPAPPTARLSRDEAVLHRMHNHALWERRPDPPGSIVAHEVAMQAQEYAYALWATAQRMSGGADAATLAAAADAGAILRTHVMRPTWHFVSPGDARWLLELTAPRVQRINAPYLARNHLDADTLQHAIGVLEGAMRDGQHCTRAQLRAQLEQHGLALSGMAMGLVMMEAELNRVVISGASIGRQRSYALFEDRVPPAAASFDRERALAELLGRYLASRGPAMLKDFSVWSGLTLGDARTGLDGALSLQPGRFEPVRADGLDCWWQPPAGEPASPLLPRVDLVQAYDEYVMSYFASKRLMQPAAYAGAAAFGPVQHTVLVDGVMAGQWRHVLRTRDATVLIAPARPLSAAERTALEHAVAAYGRYLGVPTATDWVGTP